MKRTKKTVGFALLCALLLVLPGTLSGCGAEEQAPPSDTAAPTEEGEPSSVPAQLRIFYYSTQDEPNFGDPPFKECLLRYCERYPGLEPVIETSKPGEDRDMVLNRLMADISQGNGPDILVLSRRTLESFQDNGALAELSGALPEELTEQIFDSVLQAGRIGDELYGVGWKVQVETMLAPDKVWQGETWRAADVLALLEEREAQGEPYDRWFNLSYSLTAEQMLYDLVLHGIEAGASTLVDLEQGKCFFDTPEFISVLETCRKYGEASNSREYMSWEECFAEVSGGRAMAVLAGGDLKGFSGDMAGYEEGYHCVGFPTENACGSYVNCYRVMAVNAATKNYDIAVGFLQEMLSKEVQRESFNTSSVRRDVLTENVVEHQPSFETPVFEMREEGYIELEGKADGSSWLPEYVELLDRGLPGSWEGSPIQDIVMEEASAYFNGDKSAEDVAKVIQSRVSIYLSE